MIEHSSIRLRSVSIAAPEPALVPTPGEVPETPGKAGLSRYRCGGLYLVRAGGPAGLMSAIIVGWGGDSDPVTKEVEPGASIALRN